MSSSLVQMPSPCSDSHHSSVPPEYKPRAEPPTMLKIHSLLNPESDNSKYRVLSPDSAPLTPVFTVLASSQSSTPRPDTPVNSKPPKPKKRVKDAAVFVRGSIHGTVNYPAFECCDEPPCLPVELRLELAHQHRRFKIYPAGHAEGYRIMNFSKRIPYSSEKKSFLDKTGRDGFDVFMYVFKMPEDPEQREHTVMWDYQVGLVRITPFFKACKYSKTIPAKALNSNPGLKDLSHSITGGSLQAQGYWMPYACARAVCLTFCYHIRWALTPIFGPSFIMECLRPDSHGFGRFKIHPEIVRNATLEAEGWKGGGPGRSDTPAMGSGYADMPRSAPVEGNGGPHPRRRDERPSFKVGSPFDSEPEALDDRRYVHTKAPVVSPQLSPKSKHVAPSCGGWTSINRPQHAGRPALPFDTSASSLSNSLLTEPRYSPATSWRVATNAEPRTPVAFSPTSAPCREPVPQQPHQTWPSPSPSMQIDKAAPQDSPSPTTSESEENNDAPVPTPAPKRRKISLNKDAIVPVAQGKPSKNGPVKYTAEDARAAKWLVNLSVRDSELASRPSQLRGQKRKASVS